MAVRRADRVQPSVTARTILPPPGDLNISRKGFFCQYLRHAQVLAQRGNARALLYVVE